MLASQFSEVNERAIMVYPSEIRRVPILSLSSEALKGEREKGLGAKAPDQMTRP